MALWTTPVLHALGEVFSVTDWNAIANNTTFLYQKPYAAAYCLTAQSIPSGTITQITLGGIAQIGYGFTVSSNNINIPITGVYATTGCIAFCPGSNMNAATYIYRNGGAALLAQATGFCIIVPTSGILSCGAGDTLGLYTLQASGSPQTTSVGTQDSYLHVFYIGPQ